jgi:hypothetical protein
MGQVRFGGPHSDGRGRRERERAERLNPRKQRKELLHRFAEACGLKRLSGAREALDFLEDPISIPYEACWGNAGRLCLGRSRATGSPLLVLEREEACIAFADPVAFDAICEARWRRLAEANDPHRVYFWCLVQDRFCPDCLGAEWAGWVVERKGERLLEGLRRDYVVAASPNVWRGYDLEQARRICGELGIELRISPRYHDVFRRDELPEDL